jgi:hypothetical protein
MNRAAAASRGCPTGLGAEGEPGTRRISLLTEAGAYAGAILVLAGGVTAGQPASGPARDVTGGRQR